MDALYEMNPTARMLVLLGEFVAGGSRIERVPPNAIVLDLAGDWPELTLEQRSLIALKLIQTTAPEARLHLRQAQFSQEFYRRYRHILGRNRAVLYRFCDEHVLDGGSLFAQSETFTFISECLQDLAWIITDNAMIIDRDRQRIGIAPNKWHLLPARQPACVSEAQAAASATVRRGRILWASRLDTQKRPDLLPRIADRLAERGADVQIDAFGSAVLEHFDTTRLAGRRNLMYRGAYDGFASLDASAYDAFIYTSAFDGMPNVVLEAIASGLPVIAPDVGGVGEIIVDGESGLLLPSLRNDDAMASAYVDAILGLLEDGNLRARLAVAALRRLKARHAPDAFLAATRAIFATPARTPDMLATTS